MTSIDKTDAVQAATLTLLDGRVRNLSLALFGDAARTADAVVTAALPHLAEQFARLLDDFADSDGTWIGPTDPDKVIRRAARLIREAATKTDDGASLNAAPSSPDRIEAVHRAMRAAHDYATSFPSRAAARAAVAALDAYDRAATTGEVSS